MDYTTSASSGTPPGSTRVEQHGAAATMFKAMLGNGHSLVNSTHPFGAIGEEVKAASHRSTASSCSSDDRDGGVPVNTADSRERAGSLRELVQQSTPITSTDFGSPMETSTPSRQQKVSPIKSEQVVAEIPLLPPAWTTQRSPESAKFFLEPLPSQAIGIVNASAPHAETPLDMMPVSPQFSPQHLGAIGSMGVHASSFQHALPQPMQLAPQAPILSPNLSPQRSVLGYQALVRGITTDLEKICREHVVIAISTNTADSDADMAFLDLVIDHLRSRDAAAYILKRTDLHVALVIGLIWRQLSTYILSKPVLDKAPSRSAAAFYHAWLDETFASAYDADNMNLRQALVERRSSFVGDIQRAPEYQAFVKTFATQVANDVIRDLMPVWRIGFTYKISQMLIEKVTIRLVRLTSRMRAEAKVFHFDFYAFGTQFSCASMSKRNPDLLLEHGNDATYAVMCDIAPAVFEMGLRDGKLDTTAIYLAEVLVYDKSKTIDEALEGVKLYTPMPMPPPPMGSGRRRSRRKTGTAPFVDRQDPTTMQATN